MHRMKAKIGSGDCLALEMNSICNKIISLSTRSLALESRLLGRLPAPKSALTEVHHTDRNISCYWTQAKRKQLQIPCRPASREATASQVSSNSATRDLEPTLYVARRNAFRGTQTSVMNSGARESARGLILQSLCSPTPHPHCHNIPTMFRLKGPGFQAN